MLKSLQMLHPCNKKPNAFSLLPLGSGFLAVLLFFGCASQSMEKKSPEAFPILEPAEENLSTPTPQKSAAYQKLNELLLSLGYQGMGLELEDDATLEFLYQVFSSPKARNRRIQFVYTGLQLSYDKDQASLTFGEDNHLARALKFIEKNVPLQK